MKTIVLYSMGICSAYIACRLQDECQRPLCIFNDTGQEDEDTYRFGREVQERWGLEVVDVSAGIDLFGFFRQQNMIPARQIPNCSIALKIKPTQAFLTAFPGPARVAYGYDVDEEDRLEGTVSKWRYPNLTPYAPLQEWGVSKEQCFGYFAEHGIKPPRVYRHTQHANCFSGDTRFITSEGIKTLKECDGSPVRVIGKGGKWTDAEVHSFGEQPLRRITFSRYGETKQILATGGHRWFAFKSGWFRQKGICRELTTDDLCPNDRMMSMFGPSVKFPPSPFGIAAGIVFGDGSACTYKAEGREHWNPSARLTLCGDKDRQLLKWFPNCPVHDVPGVGVSVSGLPRFFKSAPPLTESKPYLYGWLAGYFAADGCMDQNGKASLASATLDHLELARDVAALLGFPTLAIRKVMRKGFGEEATALY